MDDEIQGKTKDGWELASSVPGGEMGLRGGFPASIIICSAHKW